MIRFIKIILLVLFSCFLTTGNAFAHIQSTEKTVSCCESPSETNSCCEKNTTSKNTSCKDHACCSKMINNIVLFSEIQQDFNLQTSIFNVKQQPNTLVNLHVKNHFLAIWQPPKISLNL